MLSTIEVKTISIILAWLKTLAEHASHFSKWFLGKSKEWFNCLKSYSLSRKADVSECGLKAFKKFIHECVQSLKNETDDFKKSTTLEVISSQYWIVT